MLQDVKNSSSWREMFFFIFASPGKIYHRKLTNANVTVVKVKKNQKLLIKAAIFWIILLLSPLLYGQNLKETSLPIPTGKNLLFFLQRTPDANTVIYELNFKDDGAIDDRNPVKGSWIRYADNGKCKDLTSIEKQFAYGVKSKALGNDQFEIRLAAYKNIPIYLFKAHADQKYYIYIKDEGKNLLLKRVFVKVNGGSFWFPKVAYIDLFTVHSETGKEFLKRINFKS